jgi:hypothetical protein
MTDKRKKPNKPTIDKISSTNIKQFIKFYLADIDNIKDAREYFENEGIEICRRTMYNYIWGSESIREGKDKIKALKKEKKN